MTIVRVSMLALLLTLPAAGCGGRADSSSSPPSTSSTSSAATASRYDAGPRAAEDARDESRVAEGHTLFQTKGCSACHGFGKRLSCPDLDGVTRRRTAVWMEQQILHPDVMTKNDPISHELFAMYALQMPNQGLTAEQARAVIEFLKHHDHELAEAAHH